MTSDWIPPELRPGVGDLLVLNADKLNDVMQNPSLSDTSVDNDYYRVLADVARDPAERDGLLLSTEWSNQRKGRLLPK